jgi:hypothetical protein
MFFMNFRLISREPEYRARLAAQRRIMRSGQAMIRVVERQKGGLRAKVMPIRSFRALTKSTPLLPHKKEEPT